MTYLTGILTFEMPYFVLQGVFCFTCRYVMLYNCFACPSDECKIYEHYLHYHLQFKIFFVKFMELVLLTCIIFCMKAMLDVGGESGWLGTSLQVIHMMQAVIQARWIHDPPLLTLPILERTHLSAFLSVPSPFTLFSFFCAGVLTS